MNIWKENIKRQFLRLYSSYRHSHESHPDMSAISSSWLKREYLTMKNHFDPILGFELVDSFTMTTMKKVSEDRLVFIHTKNYENKDS